MVRSFAVGIAVIGDKPVSPTKPTWIGMGPYQCLRGARHGGEKVELLSYVSLSLYGGEWSDIGAGELGWGL
jgi:hypothetical protein